MAINKKQFAVAALIWAGCSIIFLFAYVVVLAPQMAGKEKVKRQLLEAKQTYQTALKATEEKTRTQMDEQIKHLQDEIGQFAIDFEDSVNLVFDISEIAREMHLSSFTVSPKDNIRSAVTEDGKRISKRHFHISFTGEFNQFARFLNALERNRPILFVDTFSINRSYQDNSGHQVNMDVTVFVREKQDS